jgi:hypothetical protein
VRVKWMQEKVDDRESMPTSSTRIEADANEVIRPTLMVESGIPRVDCVSGRLGGPDTPGNYTTTCPSGGSVPSHLRAQDAEPVPGMAPGPAIRRIGTTPTYRVRLHERHGGCRPPNPQKRKF